MKLINTYLLFFTITFIIVFIVYNFIIYKNKIKKKKYMNLVEVKYLVYRFKLDPSKLSIKGTLRICAVINAFIIAFTGILISMLNISILWQLSIGFAVLMALIYACYEIYGRILSKMN